MSQYHPRGVLWVVVLGDFGRSPRMQYHCMSLLKVYDVNIHVFAQSKDQQGFIPELLQAKASGRLQLWQIFHMPLCFTQLPNKVVWLLKLTLYFFTMLALMIAATVRAGRPNLMLLQSPPAVPTLAVCCLIRYLYGTATIVDFHNLAYTLMRSHPAPGQDKSLLYADDPLAVQLAGKQEQYLARFCDAALTVSQRFQHWLRDRWKVQAHVLYDKAPSFFQPTSADEAHELFQTIKPKLLDSFPPAAQFVHDAFSDNMTPVTSIGKNGKVCWRSRPRPVVVISSTSWTPDEDFGSLLEACVLYDATVADWGKAAAASALPPMLVIITGRGPQQDMYREKIANLNLTNVSFHMVWLEPRHYVVALASADIGVSLHESSSELDLPMKVSDMLGCGVPVCAVDYPTAREQVTPGETGRLFKSPSELAAILKELMVPDTASAHPRGCGRQLAEMAKNVREQREDWHTHWRSVVPAIIDGIAPKLRHN